MLQKRKFVYNFVFIGVFFINNEENITICIFKLQLFLFHRQKLQAYEDALRLYAEAKIKTANDTIEILRKALSKLGA